MILHLTIRNDKSYNISSKGGITMEEMLRHPSLDQPGHHRRWEEKGRDPYDGLRPWSAITHGLGAVLAVVGGISLLVRAYGWGLDEKTTLSFVIYALSMVSLYTASCLYHCVNTTVKGRLALRKLDHISIYLLIAGTYTPVCLVPLRNQGAWGWGLLLAVWTLALVGTVLTFFWVNAPRCVTSGIYLFMGWVAVGALGPLNRAMGAAGMTWLMTGAALYTLGGILYAAKWPGRNNPRFGCHEIFHVFILFGSVAHYIMIYSVFTRL